MRVCEKLPWTMIWLQGVLARTAILYRLGVPKMMVLISGFGCDWRGERAPALL